jgi:hypothetical protein
MPALLNFQKHDLMFVSCLNNHFYVLMSTSKKHHYIYVGSYICPLYFGSEILPTHITTNYAALARIPGADFETYSHRLHTYFNKLPCSK